VKDNIKQLEERKDYLETTIQSFMQYNAELVAFDGNILATWKNTKPTKKFDSKLFQQAMPDIYEKFVVEQSGFRRFLIK
jgi:predicted phage-related endonuclease